MSVFHLKRFPKVVFGEGAYKELPELISHFGNKALIITMRDLFEIHLMDPVLDLLKESDIDFKIYKDAKPEPKIENYKEAIDFVRSESFDVIIAFGGGSVIDFAKGLSIVARHDQSIWDYVNLSNKPPAEIYSDKLLPVIAIPTTSGTGSEVTPYSVVINQDTEQEGTIKDELIIPKAAIVDPSFTIALPKEWTAITGLDAFAHALESLFNKENRTDYSDLIAMEAIRNIVQYLPLAFNDGKNIVAREKVAYGATLAGMAISLAGTTVCHALVHPTDARFGIPHGKSVSIYTTAVLRHTLPNGIDIFNKVIPIFNPQYEVSNKVSSISKGLNFIEEFIAQFNLDLRLSDYGINKKESDVILRDALGYMFRPIRQHEVIFDEKDLKKIIADCF